MFACVLQWALASVAADFIDADPPIFAGCRACIALVDVLFAGLSREEARAGTDVVGLERRALAAVGTGI